MIQDSLLGIYVTYVTPRRKRQCHKIREPITRDIFSRNRVSLDILSFHIFVVYVTFVQT
jgi:hypothetical protein